MARVTSRITCSGIVPFQKAIWFRFFALHHRRLLQEEGGVQIADEVVRGIEPDGFIMDLQVL